jgi:endonuclease/exonuclease/phosphatase family metal-dependent hydrolase
VKYFNFIVAVVLTIVYATGKIPPSEKYNLWLVSFVIPFALAINVILLVISLSLRKKSSLYYIVTLVIGSNYLLSTIALKSIFKKHIQVAEDVTMLSYNTHSLGGHYGTPSSFVKVDKETAAFKDWIIDQNFDIQCYQEFVNYFEHPDLDLIAIFKSKGYHSYFSFDSSRMVQRVAVGTLITSKYPIINSGDILASKNGFNRVTYVDLKIKNDTLRVVNVHLESMGLKQFNPVVKSGFDSKKENAQIILMKLKVGVFERSRQIKILIDFIEKSPFPVICAGDFNDMPYSYSYQFVKRRMNNAFEEVGKGFGFTYHGNTLRVLRIDNQFYSSKVRAHRFETLHDVKFSDHFPVLGTYSFKRETDNE